MLLRLVELLQKVLPKPYQFIMTPAVSHTFYLDDFHLDTLAIRFYAHSESKPAFLLRRQQFTQ